MASQRGAGAEDMIKRKKEVVSLLDGGFGWDGGVAFIFACYMRIQRRYRWYIKASERASGDDGFVVGGK